jgi:molecular chaperone IbpA
MATGMTIYTGVNGTNTYTYTHPVSLVDSLTTRGVGFQNQFRFFEELFNSAPASKYPPYDILSVDENEYEIRFAVAGFKKSEIDVTYVNGVLTVKGNKEEESTDAYFHKGIATRDFTQTFPLAEYVEVTSAEMEDGILTIKLKRELPEELQSKKIKIK